MNTNQRLALISIILSLVTASCGIDLNLPVTRLETGPTQTENIQLAMPAEPATSVELRLEFAAGELRLSPGGDGYLASGTATYNVADFKPEMEINGEVYTLRSGVFEVKGLPKLQEDIQNKWDLKLADVPLSLDIKAGAYTGSFEIGGLALEKLAISEGGSDLTCAFSQPNKVEMSSFTFSTGGSNIELTGLANANFTQMNFSAGAGDYTLSFDGDLQRAASVTIDAGLGTVNLIVPQGVNAQVNFDGGLTTITTTGGWKQDGTVYSLSVSGPALTITVKMGAGTLNLKTE